MSIIQFMQQEQTQAGGQLLEYVSPSRLSLWMKCPLAFRKRYIDGYITAPSPALFVGKITHSVLAHVYRMRGAGQDCTADTAQFAANPNTLHRDDILVRCLLAVDAHGLKLHGVFNRFVDGCNAFGDARR